jgi:glycosyltransferase involved in cell wall biosynthesis
MKVIQIPFCFSPDAVGGTEVYVASLARLLKDEHGCDVLIAAPGGRSENYTHQDLPVRRFAVSNAVGDVSELYGEGDELAAREFAKILDQERPDIVHLHAFTRGVSLKIVRAAKAREIPVVFTYHTPTVTCTRGTMMRRGRIPCDGEMLGRRCTACTLQGLGLNRLVATGFASMPRWSRDSLAKTKKSGGIWTALRMRELVEKRHVATRAFLSEVDHIVAVCDWVRDVLIRNGVPANKITLCRQGIERAALDEDGRSPLARKSRRLGEKMASGTEEPTARREDDGAEASPEQFTKERPLRLVYFGRLDSTKGVHVLIEAMRLGKELPVTFDIYGNAQGESGAAYATGLKNLAGNDPRIRFCLPVAADQVVRTLRQYDMLAVPSQLLETGPLVVLEAFAAGIPVLGSNLGGIAELVNEGVNGFLVKGTGAEEWCCTLKRLCSDSSALAKLHRSISSPPTMSAVAQTMVRLYQKLPVPSHASA